MLSTSGDRRSAALTAFASSDYVPAKMVSDLFTPGKRGPLVTPKAELFSTSSTKPDLCIFSKGITETPANGQHLQQLLLLLFHTGLDHASCPSLSLSVPE